MFKNMKTLGLFLLMSANLWAITPAEIKIASTKGDQNLKSFYEQRAFEPLWVEGDHLKDSADYALEAFTNASYEGLNPKDYAKAAKAVMASKNDKSQLLNAEMALSQTLLTYIDDMNGERLNPKKVSHELYLAMVNFDAVAALKTHMEQDSSGKWIKGYTFNNPRYKALKEMLGSYLDQLKKEGEESWPQIASDKLLKKGSTGDSVTALQTQLKKLGYYDGAATGTLDDLTETALKSFQEHNDADPDGVLGPHTLAILNDFNIHNRIEKIIISMERWRWMGTQMPNRYVQVNIAGFILDAIQDGQKVLEMPVIIGQNYRKTPVFKSEIYEVRFNPAWHVPRSIAVKDKLSKIQNDPGYLASKGFSVYDSSGARVSADSVDWSSLDGSNFDYRLVQAPGDMNALGKIRFSIKSNFDIYLHSTPDVHLFDKPLRNFSSGCIRVKDPKNLAVFVFNDTSTWPYDVISNRMEGTKTENIQLPSKLPVYITYFTVWFDKDQKPHFSADIYGQDQLVQQALDNLSKQRG